MLICEDLPGGFPRINIQPHGAVSLRGTAYFRTLLGLVRFEGFLSHPVYDLILWPQNRGGWQIVATSRRIRWKSPLGNAGF